MCMVQPWVQSLPPLSVFLLGEDPLLESNLGLERKWRMRFIYSQTLQLPCRNGAGQRMGMDIAIDGQKT